MSFKTTHKNYIYGVQIVLLRSVGNYELQITYKQLQL